MESGGCVFHSSRRRGNAPRGKCSDAALSGTARSAASIACSPRLDHIRANCVSTPVQVHSPSVPAAAIQTLLISLAYVVLLIAALVIVNIVLTRRTREEREAERLRRRQRKPS
jgi:hypothetical protein